MKKILNTLMLMLSMIGIASCSDNGESDYLAINPIKVISQSVSDMDVKASEGEIVVEAPAQIDATASADWFTTSVSRNTITVKTTDNNGIEYRYGKVIIKSGDYVTEVAVIQKGTVLSLESNSQYLDDAKADIEITYTSSLDFKCYSTEDWLTCKSENGKISIAVEENATGHMRSGYVFYEAGSLRDSIFIQQCDPEKDLLGKMQFVFLDRNSGEYNVMNAEFVAGKDKDGNTSYNIALSDLGFVLPVTFNDKLMQLTLRAGQFTGEFQEYGIYTAMADAKTGNMTFDNNVSMSGRFIYDKNDDVTYLLFEDNGSWGEATASSIVLYAFDTKEAPVGVLVSLDHPYLIK